MPPFPAATDAAIAERRAPDSFAWRAALRRPLREPLLHFLVLGALLYGANALLHRPTDAQRVVVTRADIDGIAANYQLQYGDRPTPSQLTALIDAFVREEIYYREAVRAGLDRDDEIVRRRLVQKFEFLQQDLTTVPEPADAQLNAWFVSHRAQYQRPPRISFTQVYFSPDVRGEQAAFDSAVRERARLVDSGRTRAPEEGDTFPGTSDFAALTAPDLDRIFGPSSLTAQLFSLPPASWSQPLRSGLGWHLVRIDAVQPAQMPALAEVSDRVRRDYLESQRNERNDDAHARLRDHYAIVFR